MARVSNPFANAPRFDPYAPGGRLAPTARQHPSINIVSVEERTRAAQLTAELQSGGANLAPTFKPVATPAPYTETTLVGTPPKHEAGGSK
jgi:hypothetical protein